jgi:hypothetical protein
MSTKTTHNKNHHHSPARKWQAVGAIVQVVPCTKRRGSDLEIFQGKVVEILLGGYKVKIFHTGYAKPWRFTEVHDFRPRGTVPL